MREVSTEFASLLATNHTLLVKATIELADGSSIELGQDDFMSGTVKFEQAVSSDMSFDIGSAIVGTMSATLANHDGRFDEYDLGGATITAYVGKELSSSTEWLLVGTYDVMRPDSYGGTIGITCSDLLNRLARISYSELEVSYPVTVRTLLSTIVSQCGLTLTYLTEPVNGSVPISRAPDYDMTLLDAAGHLAQVMGLWLKCAGGGNLVASWYDTTDSASIGDAFSTTVMTDDITITGVQVAETDEIVQVTETDEGTGDTTTVDTNGRAGGTYLAGTDDYCLAILSNPFVPYGYGDEVATALFSRVGGTTFRPYNDSMPCDPTIEAGDAVVVTDRNGNTYNSLVTGVVLKPDGAMVTRCSAKSKESNASTVTSSFSAAVTQLKAVVERIKQISDYAYSVAESAQTGAEEAAALAAIGAELASYFWVDEGGAHVGTVAGKSHESGAGYNMTFGATETTTGLILDYDDETLLSLTPSALNFYITGLVAAAFDSAGMAVYSQGTQMAAFTQAGATFYDGSGTDEENELAKIGSTGARFGAPGGAQVKITSSRVAMLDETEEVAYIGSGELGASKAKITDELDLGGFAWVPRSNGNLALKWMGA